MQNKQLCLLYGLEIRRELKTEIGEVMVVWISRGPWDSDRRVSDQCSGRTAGRRLGGVEWAPAEEGYKVGDHGSLETKANVHEVGSR